MTLPTLHRWADVEKEQLNPLLQRQFISGSQSTVARFELAKGCIIPTHSHPNEQIAFVLDGSMRFFLGDETYIVNAGELLVIPGGVPHSAEVLKDSINIDIFSPPRQDWLNKDDAYLR